MKKGKLRQNHHRNRIFDHKEKSVKNEISVSKFYNPLIINTGNALGTTIRHKAVLS